MAVAFLLYRTMVPSSHGWNWPLLTTILSLEIWRPIAKLSFCSYLIHFRILMELTLRESSRRLVGLSLPDNFDAARSSEWIVFMGKFYLVGMMISLSLSVSHILYYRSMYHFETLLLLSYTIIRCL